jgi:hypothetical protein
MWRFGAKRPGADRLPIDGPWVVAEGHHDGKPMLVRIHDGYRGFNGVASYEHQIGIAVRLQMPEPDGLPSGDEDMKLSGIEDALCELLEQDAESLFVAVVTTGGMREFVFYTNAPELIRLRVDALRPTAAGYDLQLMVQPDKRWEVYSKLLP